MSVVTLPRRGPANEQDARPVIQLGPELHEIVDTSIAALERDAELFQRDATLVRVVRVVETDAKHERMSAGSPQIHPVPIATLRERLTRVAQYERFDRRSEEWCRTMPPGPVVEAVAGRKEWATVRPIAGVIETPSMRPDGSLIDVPGYDRATGFLYAPSRIYPAVPSDPTIEDARAALAALVEPWSEFPVCSDAARYVPVAALLNLISRPAICGACPAYLFDATDPGSGKTLMMRGVSILAHGREAALATWPADDVEIEKILGGYALRAASVVAWDNVTGTFGGAPIDKVLSCGDRVSLRVLGQSAVPEHAWRAVTLANGNNLVIGGDTSRRVLVCRMEPMVERPEERTDYAITDLAQWCHAHHPRLVVAGLTLLRAFVVAGRPSQGLTGWGSFEAFRDLIPSAILWAGGPDVTACRPTVAGEDDAEKAALRVIVAQLPRLTKDLEDQAITAKGLIDALYPAERQRGGAAPDEYDELREALETLAKPKEGYRPDSLKLGKALGRKRKQVVDAHYVDRVTGHAKTLKWKVCGVRP